MLIVVFVFAGICLQKRLQPVHTILEEAARESGFWDSSVNTPSHFTTWQEKIRHKQPGATRGGPLLAEVSTQATSRSAHHRTKT